MFQLIVAVISIALVAALAIASLYYGGQAFQQSSLKANVTTLVNAGQQIAGADALYKIANSGAGVADGEIDDLIPEYLAAAPGVSAAGTGAWEIETAGTSTRVAFVLVNEDSVTPVCQNANEQAGLAKTAAWTGTTPTAQFGCYTDADDDAVKFGFKL